MGSLKDNHESQNTKSSSEQVGKPIRDVHGTLRDKTLKIFVHDPVDGGNADCDSICEGLGKSPRPTQISQYQKGKSSVKNGVGHLVHVGPR